MKQKLVVVLLAVAMVCLMATPLMAAGQGGTTASGEAAEASGKNEAPELSAKVAAGELPPLEERLPKEPLVLSEEWDGLGSEFLKMEPGRYGGTLRTITTNANFDPDTLLGTIEPLLGLPEYQTDKIRGNVLKSYEASPDAKVFTFAMREGLKWSDGMPVTSADVLFAYEDVLLNEKLTPDFPSWLKSGGEPMKLEIIDEYNFRISFAETKGNFPVDLAIVGFGRPMDVLKPSHYLKQFHTRYTPLEELEPLIEEAELPKEEWWTFFNQKDITTFELTRSGAEGFPVLSAWVMVEKTQATTSYERNPYFFKVDTEGKQLPYIDRIKTTVVSGTDAVTLKVVAGEVGYLHAYASGKDLPLYLENAEKGGYEVVYIKSFVPPAFGLNLTYPDPVWREVVGDVRFRKALSLGINREDIIETVFLGRAGVSTIVDSTYDPAEANQLLDEMGMDERDSDGMRLGPDGNTFVVHFTQGNWYPELVPIAEIVIDNFKDLGIKTTIKPTPRDLYREMEAENETLAGVRSFLGKVSEFKGQTGTGVRLFAKLGPAWIQWWESDGEMGEEPPREVKRYMELADEAYTLTPGTPENTRVWDEAYDLLRENYWLIPVVDEVFTPVIVPANSNFADIEGGPLGIAISHVFDQMFFRE